MRNVPPRMFPPARFHDPFVSFRRNTLPVLSRVPEKLSVPPTRLRPARLAVEMAPPRPTVELVKASVPEFVQENGLYVPPVLMFTVAPLAEMVPLFVQVLVPKTFRVDPGFACRVP